MAGTNSEFDVDEFRSAIRFAMEMGMPTVVSQQLVWHWRRDQTFIPDDPAGNPYSWTQATVTDAPGNPLQAGGTLIVDYALEFAARQSLSQDTSLGQFDATHAIVTLLDEDYELIKTADYATIDGDEYEIDFSGPPIGLFDATVHQVYLTAKDEG